MAHEIPEMVIDCLPWHGMINPTRQVKMEKLENESQAAFNVRCRLMEAYGAKFLPSNSAHFFDNIWKNDVDEQTVVYFLDSVYAALQSQDKKIAFRAYVQACEYSSNSKFRFLRYHWETAFHDAKMRIESFLEA